MLALLMQENAGKHAMPCLWIIQTCFGKLCGTKNQRSMTGKQLTALSQPKEEPQHYTDQANTHAGNLVTGMHRGCVALLRCWRSFGTACS